MLDSSDQLHQLKELIKGTQLRLGERLECELGEGWFELLKETIDEIKEHSVEIACIDASYGELDIRLSPYEDANSVAAFVAVHDKRVNSRNICSKCGVTIHKYSITNAMEVLCKYCETEKAKSGKTGTWLDNY